MYLTTSHDTIIAARAGSKSAAVKSTLSKYEAEVSYSLIVELRFGEHSCLSSTPAKSVPWLVERRKAMYRSAVACGRAGTQSRLVSTDISGFAAHL